MKRLISILLLLLIATTGHALDVNNKTYILDDTIIAFQQGPYGPGSNGLVYLTIDNIVNGIYEYHQNTGDPIVNLGDFGVFYQSPSDVLTFIPPPFIVFNPMSYPVH
jgi:hypothetical protein